MIWPRISQSLNQAIIQSRKAASNSMKEIVLQTLSARYSALTLGRGSAPLRAIPRAGQVRGPAPQKAICQNARKGVGNNAESL